MDKHYSKLSSGENIVCTDTMQALPSEPSLTSLNEPSDLEEVATTVMNLKFNKVKINMQSQVKPGLTALAVPLLHLMFSWWSTSTISQDFMNVKTTTLYKQKSDREV